MTFKDMVSLNYVKQLCLGGMKGIQKDTMTLAKAFTQFLKDTKHKNGDRIAVIYGKNWEYINDYNGEDKQGPVVNFNLLRVDGSVIGFVEVSHFDYIVICYFVCYCYSFVCYSKQSFSILFLLLLLFFRWRRWLTYTE